MAETVTIRFRRKHFESDAIIPAQCPCCGDITLLLVDEKGVVRAVGALSIAELKEIIADAEAGKLQTIDDGSGDDPSAPRH